MRSWQIGGLVRHQSQPYLRLHPCPGNHWVIIMPLGHPPPQLQGRGRPPPAQLQARGRHHAQVVARFHCSELATVVAGAEVVADAVVAAVEAAEELASFVKSHYPHLGGV